MALTPYWTLDNGDTVQTLYHGDALAVLRELPNESVHCVVTSPPYYGLRDYGVDGQIGLEETPQEYVERLVEVFREVWRVLRRDGTVWLNLGDCYAGSSMTGGVGRGTLAGSQHGSVKGADLRFGMRRDWSGLKPKDLVGIPWLVAFALRDDGWWLRSDIIWNKPNPMPESVTDRPTRSHEYLFLLAKNERYFYDADAIREPHSDKTRFAYPQPDKASRAGITRNGKDNSTLRTENPAGRNKRSVWTIQPEPLPEAHFATFPTALVEPCILAGTSPMACPMCGAQWERVVEKQFVGDNSKTRQTYERHGVLNRRMHPGPHNPSPRTHLGFAPTCSCSDNDGSGRCVVLDPFAGSGTTLLVASQLGRNGIGIELNETYCAMAARRIGREHAQGRLRLPTA